MRNGFRITGIALVFLGVALVLNSGIFLTGLAISGSTGSNLGYLIRGGGFIGGIIILIGGILLWESAVADERRTRKSDLEKSVQEAVAQGVPESDAKIIHAYANKKVSSGKWVELGKITVRDTNNPEEFPHGTSLCRYWGPSEYLGSSAKKLKNLYDEGVIGKTHEVVRGSDTYRTGGRESEGTMSVPEVGRVLHRHWEIAQMYKKIRYGKGE
ncbi:hypothetical protein CO038_01445 [Candidatus Pacearchaeota archaeon CG_4_9_14_0_2_um_filter_39_13]|nr:hypothetical protein [Candidatus Pacearchaeota archaeon]OIO43778.1 MAG: hypothetical protein AUJ64_01700 [Candidatus Pacearchaeota archaeon CG1_02_39_14]PJC44873.1 MAG: hypothetical protein CO038_01445 [Candidatus Pacearchaeota archaeon CG_4_9_14_0_2_um_filter_39_13]